MVSFSSSFSLLLLLFLLQQSPSPTIAAAAAADHDIVLETCERCARGDPNVNYALCVRSLGSAPKSRRSDLRGLAVIAAKLARANATRARSEVKKLLKADPMDPRMKSTLETCLELYSDAMDSLRDSIKAIKSGRYTDANVFISAAVDAPDDCEGAFQEMHFVSPLAEENKDLFGLAVIALTITSLLG